MLVKSVLKRRPWWNYADKNDESLNLLWTQWCRQKFVKALGCAAPKETTAAMAPASETEKVWVPTTLRMCNHLERHYHLSNKKAMFINLVRYYTATKEDPFNTLPLTFHIAHGCSDPEYDKFVAMFREKDVEAKTGGRKHGNVWIIKPGENTNRGHGIQVVNELDEVKRIIGSSGGKGGRTFIVQKYIEKPLLINKRKFDIRMYGLVTSINGWLKAYFYEEGYIRTSSKEYSLKNLTNKAVHLTNDAVQQKEEDYGKFESGNKLSFAEFQKYLDTAHPGLHVDFTRDLLPQIKKIVTDTFRAVHHIIDPHKRQHTFEIFGYDFMIDQEFKLYLIEVNTNPCLEVSSPLLGRIITNMVDTGLKYAFGLWHNKKIGLQWTRYFQDRKAVAEPSAHLPATFCQKSSFGWCLMRKLMQHRSH